MQRLTALFLSLVFMGVTAILISYASLGNNSISLRSEDLVPNMFVQHENCRNTSDKPWYLGGTNKPKNSNCHLRLFPEQADGDRILEQLMYVPEDYKGYDTPRKVILIYYKLEWLDFGLAGIELFQNCPVERCYTTRDRDRATDADAILFKHRWSHPGYQRPDKQVWIIYTLECPYHIGNKWDGSGINWTATYRADSDIVVPYGKWVYFDPGIREKPQSADYAANKTKKVAWFVSNCRENNKRSQYAKELSKYIDVDIYGKCGSLKCPRGYQSCFEMLRRDYKFYLAFENSNCRDYITEKLYKNSLDNSILPIVMGARPDDYAEVAPEGSYIHVEDFLGPKELAEFLHRLDKNDSLYNLYFRWKGTGQFIDTHFWCRLCAMLHAPITPRYKDLSQWWSGTGICTNNFWRNNEEIPKRY